jgi:p-aminobenzoyl-glutamate transporter AbgT
MGGIDISRFRLLFLFLHVGPVLSNDGVVRSLRCQLAGAENNGIHALINYLLFLFVQHRFVPYFSLGLVGWIIALLAESLCQYRFHIKIDVRLMRFQ